MVANYVSEETELVSEAVSWLRDRLPGDWVVEKSNRAFAAKPGQPQQALGDAAIDLRAPNGGGATLAVEVKRTVSPRDVDLLVPRLARTLMSLVNTPVLLVAPWIGRRSRQLLEEQGINYIDRTGNGYLSLGYPPVFI